jgi:hypothetical protein
MNLYVVASAVFLCMEGRSHYPRVLLRRIFSVQWTEEKKSISFGLGIIEAINFVLKKYKPMSAMHNGFVWKGIVMCEQVTG